MPVEKVKIGGRVGYRWGKQGKVYTGKDAKKKATRQGKAIKAKKGVSK